MTTINYLKNNAIALIFLSLGFTACNNNKKSQEDLQQSVMAAHDSVMANMGNLIENKTRINNTLSHLDSLKAANSTLDTAKIRIELSQTIKQLSSADDEMMAWMRNFNPDYAGKSHEEVMAYLNEQKVKINSVDNSIEKILVKSDSLILKYK